MRSGALAAVAAVLALVFGGLFSVVHVPANVNDTPRVPADISYPPPTQTSLAPPVPAFYNVDKPVPGGPGAVIKSEAVSGGPSDVDAQRMIYNSRDDKDRDVPVSGLVVVPKATPPPGGFPVIAYAHGTSGVGRPCGASIAPFEPYTAGYSFMETQILPLVRQGYAVVATDYLGMGAPGTPMYLVSKVEGQNVLDSVRAVHRLRTDVNRHLSVIWGHSQGGHSALAAAEMAPAYAPDLTFQGAAVLAPGLLPALKFAVDGILSGTKPSGMTGFVMLIGYSWSQTYPEQVKLSELATPAAIANLQAVETKCGSGYAEPFMAEPMSAYVHTPLPNSFFHLMDLNTPGSQRIKMPVAMVQGMEDTTIIPQLTLGMAKELCNNRTVLDFEIYEYQDHGGVVVASRPFLDQWIKDRLAGEPAPDNCPNTRLIHGGGEA